MENDGEVKKKNNNPNNIGKFINSIPASEKEAHYARVTAKAKETKARKKQIIIEAKKAAQKLLPELIAQDLLRAEGENYTPRKETIDKLKALQDAGLTFDEMRKRHFSAISDTGWHKLTKFAFKSLIEQPEDLGLDLVSAKKKHLKMLKRRCSMLRKEIKEWKKEQKKSDSKKIGVPHALLSSLATAEDKFMELEMDFAKTLHSIGAVGSKVKSASINIFTSIPRPKDEESIDVTPKKITLDDLIKA